MLSEIEIFNFFVYDHLKQLPAYIYLITGLIQLDCFGRSVCPQCVLTIKRG